jgi:oxidase EvaA
MEKTIEYLFLKSALTTDNPFNSTIDVHKWIIEKNNEVSVNLTRVTFSELDKWSFDKNRGSLVHESGGFFSIDGIRVLTNWGEKQEWEQPIINQPEIGYLGIITKEFDGILYFLLQAKIEPGNVNNVQLSPTLQATKSNYSQLHKGKKPLYLNYFQEATKGQVLLDQLQSEQGARFLRKRNRNIIIKIDQDFPVDSNYIWLTLGQIKELLKYDNVVNMDTRTVISGIPFGSYDKKPYDWDSILNSACNSDSFEYNLLKSTISSEYSLYSFTEILNWFTALKSQYELKVQSISLFNVKDWVISENSIHHINNKYFQIIPTAVEISNREVQKWSQPLVQPMQNGICAFLIKEIDGIFHFLVQAKLECGNFDILEMAPTVQCITDSYDHSEEVPFLDYILTVNQEQIKHDSLQSEEGGRFYREQNRNLLVMVNNDFPLEVPDNFIWITISQLSVFLKFNNFLNIQARSLFSLINFISKSNEYTV